MSVIPATRTHPSDEEVVAEPLAPPSDNGVLPAAGVIADHDPGASTPAPTPLRPIPSRNGATPGVAAATRALRRVSPRDLRPPRHYPPRLDFLEPSEVARDMDESPRPANSKTPVLATMSTQRLVILAVGLVLLMGGLFALRFPVFLGDFDQWGFQINCGSGLHSAFTQAVIADSAGTQFVDRCHTALAVRRAWTIPLAAAGVLLLSTLLISPSRGRSANLQTADDAPSSARSHNPES